MSDGELAGARAVADRPLGDRWEAAGAGRPDEFAICCTVDVRYEDPLTEGPLRGVDALDRHGAAAARAARPARRAHRPADLRRRASGVPALADRRHAAGRPRRHPATNKFLTPARRPLRRAADDLICRVRGFFDLYDAATQLGLLPKNGSLAQNALLMLRGFGLRIRN